MAGERDLEKEPDQAHHPENAVRDTPTGRVSDEEVSISPPSSERDDDIDAQPIPRHQRRGLFAQCTLVAEIPNPYRYSRRLKWCITFIISIAGAAAPTATSIILPALGDVAVAFDSGPTTANLSVSMFMLAMAICPLWWSSFSETYGRRSIYLISFALYLFFNIMAAIAPTIGVFVAMRTLSGGAAASVQAVGAGTIADVWAVEERGTAMGMFYLGPLLGPLCAPILGGIMTQTLGWRSVQWFLAIYGGVILLLLFFALPETLKNPTPLPIPPQETSSESRPQLSRTSTRQSIQMKTSAWLTLLRRFLIDPLRIILYIRYPSIALSVLYASLLFGSLYALNISIQETFAAAPYNYPPLIVGVCYIPGSVGYIISSIVGGRWSDHIINRAARRRALRDAKGRPVCLPEDRLRENAWFGGLAFPTALLLYGWTVARVSVPSVVPLLASFLFGLGSMLLFAAITTMLTELLPRRASAGVALNNFVRNIFSASYSAFTHPALLAITNAGLFSLLAAVSLLAGVVVILATRTWGARWRAAMPAALTGVEG